MASLYFYKYNNYYNRQVKRIEKNGQFFNPDDMTRAGATLLTTVSYYNNKWLDGVSQKVIINYDVQLNDSPDYCLIVEDNGMSSLWFVLENMRLRNGQFEFTLLRDLINTYFDKIVTAPCFIEKATLQNENNLIFNKELMTFNQIKKKEISLYDYTHCAWLVGYLAENVGAISSTFSMVDNTAITPGTRFVDWEYYQYVNSPLKRIKANSIIYNIYCGRDIIYPGIPTSTKVTSIWFDELDNKTTYNELSYPSGGGLVKNLDSSIINNRWFNLDTLRADVINAQSAVTDTVYKDILSYDGKRIKFSDGVYVINLLKTNSYKEEQHVTSFYNNLSVDIKNTLNDNITGLTYSGNPFGYECDIDEYRILATKVAGADSYSYSITTGARKLNNAPYKMFCIPFPIDEAINVKVNNTNLEIDSNLSLAWAMDIAKKADAQIYDLQVVPYFPIISEKVSYVNNVLTFNSYGTIDLDYTLLKNASSQNVSVMFFALSNTFRTKIANAEADIVVRDYKVENECDLYRICSPNYNGVFEMSAAKNDGFDNWEAECTYKPYNPYICVHPEFKRLYGANYKDSRGLICGGDFSIDIAKDAFISYELQNKNYQKTFQRGIESMEFSNRMQNIQATVGAISGTAQGAAIGAAAGAKAGPYGAIAGAAMGTITSGIGGAFDVAMLKASQRETLDYTYDLFGYQLDNIKALPYSLSKVSSINANSKYIPFLEVYSASDEEKEALKNKIKYNGMSVGIIDKIENYLYAEPTYIKAKIIRFEDMDIDYHEANLIAEEFNKGVFI